MEFNKTVDSCTEEQLQTAIHDLLNEPPSGEMALLKPDDSDEPTGYYRLPLLSQGQAVESADITNCYLLKDNKTLTFSFEVSSLSDLPSPLKPPFKRVNTMEWYL